MAIKVDLTDPSRMYLASAIDWANALKWPIVVIILALVAIAIFRPAINAWIKHAHHVKLPGGLEIEARHSLPAATYKARESLKEAASHNDPEALERLSNRSVDLGWMLAKAGLRPTDVELRCDDEEPIAVAPFSAHKKPPGYAASEWEES
jgi:hypothetical protein